MPTPTPTEARKRETPAPSPDVRTALATTGVHAPRVPESVCAAAVETARLLDDLAATNARAAQIRDELIPAAALRARDAFAEALAAGETDEPEPNEILELQTEFASLERRAAALEIAHEARRQELIAAVDRARPRWLAELQGDVATRTEAYRSVLAQLRTVHVQLADAVAAERWLRDPAGNPKGIAVMSWVPGDIVIRPGEALATSEVFAALERLVTEWTA